MSKTRTTPDSAEDKAPEYSTRYGITTADKAAYELLDRAWARLCFLENVLDVAHQGGEGLTMKGYSSQGLAHILEDMAVDVFDALQYYAGNDDAPGKIGDAPGGRQ